MRFLIVTLAPMLLQEDGHYHSYAPYVKEMDIWLSHTDTVAVVSPTSYSGVLLLTPFKRKDIEVASIPTIAFNSIGGILKSMFFLPVIFLRLFQQMKKADHIHLRCPGNIGLLGCMVQIFFPKKKKTAKYAGNWDPKAKQPRSYRLQKWILNNERLTKNMRVLVYGEWPSQSKNIKPFFTATYPRSMALEPIEKRIVEPLRFLFVGMLSPGKHPLYAVQLVEALHKSGISCHFDFYGDGAERENLASYILKKQLSSIVTLHGNKDASEIAEAYQRSDFLVLPSGSEGWPKVVAEAMFWGVIPVVTKVSCVPWMLDLGGRGVLLDMIISEDTAKLTALAADKAAMQKMSKNASEWSRQYTLDDFSEAIEKLMK